MKVLLVGLIVVVWMTLITAVARDMDARGQDGRVYGLLMLVVPVGLVIWLVNRSRHPRVAEGQS